MPDIESVRDSVEESEGEVRARAAILERRLAEAIQQSETRLILSELKLEAMRAGMIDLDGLKLLDLSAITLSEKGEVNDAIELMVQLKKSKPWLFGPNSSSSSQSAPVAQLPRQKHATEMTSAEYAAAKAALLKPRS